MQRVHSLNGCSGASIAFFAGTVGGLGLSLTEDRSMVCVVCACSICGVFRLCARVVCVAESSLSFCNCALCGLGENCQDYVRHGLHRASQLPVGSCNTTPPMARMILVSKTRATSNSDAHLCQRKYHIDPHVRQ